MRQVELAVHSALSLPEGESVSVSPTPNDRIAGFRVELEPVKGSSPKQMKALLVDQARTLESEPWARRVIAVPPNLYLDIHADALSEFLRPEILGPPAGIPGLPPLVDGILRNVSYCSPNANKPLHLGHARNLTIGGALANLLEAVGYQIVRTAVFSDYGVHIARAVAAYLHSAGPADPEAAGLKSDHLVGRYYVEGAARGEGEGEDARAFNKVVVGLLDAYLAGDRDTWREFRRLTLWATKGFKRSFRRFGCTFDRFFWESETLELCRELLKSGLEQGALERRADGSVWVAGIPEKEGAIVARSDSSPLYLLQVMATTVRRFELYGSNLDLYISLSAVEQAHHFSRFLDSMDALGYDYRQRLHCVLYGLVYHGDERLRSREGAELTLDAVLDQLEDRFRQLLTERQEPIEAAASLAVGTLRTYLLSHKLTRPVHFDEGDLLEGRGRLFYHVYQVLRRARQVAQGHRAESPTPEVQVELLRELCRLGGLVQYCAVHLDPTRLTTYLRDLCEVGYRYLGGAGDLTGNEVDARMLTVTMDHTLRILDLPGAESILTPRENE